MHTLNQVNQPRRKLTLRSMIILVLIVIVAPLIPYSVAAVKEGLSNPNPGAQLWRDVRQRDGTVVGQTQARGVDSGILISKEGEQWRQFRMQQFTPYSAMIFAAIIGAFVLYFLVRGRIRIEGQRSGETIQRTTLVARYIHWFAAVIFVLLALTGLILLYGRWVLIPVLGPEGFSATAIACKNIHNYIGPLFLVSVVLLFFVFVRDSLFNFKVDTKWFLKAGGYLGGSHPSSEKFNAGQKAWFWVAILGGLVLALSGLVLDFANYGQGRILMQDAHIIHSISSVLVIAFFFVHVYLASIGMEGALEAMTSGDVDTNWAKQHHDLWYDEMKGQGGGKQDTEA